MDRLIPIDRCASAPGRKIAIIGVGHVGASIAYALTLRSIAAEIVLINRNRERARGEALDIRHGIPYMGTSSVRVGDYEDCSDSGLIIITAGRSRRPGETRINLIADNAAVMDSVLSQIEPYYNGAPILIVTNPVDVMVAYCDRRLGGARGAVFGTGCILDSSRFVRQVADYVGLSTGVVNGCVVGEHGDSQIPIWSRLTVGGIPAEEYCAGMELPWGEEQKRRIAEKVKTMGAQIIAAKGMTHYGIATCVGLLADAVINRRPTIASVSSPLAGEYGIEGVALSVPSIVSAGGVERRIEEKWSADEMERFYRSAEALRKALQSLA